MTLKEQQRPEAHPPPEPERMVAHTHDQHPALDHIPESSETSFATVDSHIDLEHIPMHVLGLDTIHKGALIGSGGMSAVYNGKYGTIPVALKQTVESGQLLLNEIEILAKIQHPNVVQVYGIWQSHEQQVFLV